jgi:hypothetical protein
MKKTTIYILLAFIAFSTSSCSKYLQSGNGGFSDVSLNRNSDEYTIKRLKQIELDGNAFCGIPGLLDAQNNKNKNKSGMMFRFNGIEIGRTPRILPIITMLGFTIGYTEIMKSVIKNKNVKAASIDNNGNITKKNAFFNNENIINYGSLRTGWAAILGLPFAGATNNLLWNGVAASGLTNQVYYKLVDENQDIDVFVNPKYKVDYHPGIFTQKAHVILNATGATLKMK